jgi:carboxyl-terminal processing protease
VLDLGFTLSKQVNGDYTVDYLTYGTPAYNSDLRHGDVIKSIGGKALAGLSEQDAKALTSAKLNDKVEVVFYHDGKDDKLTLTSAATPDPKVLAKSMPNGSVYMRLPNFSKEGLESFEQTLVQVEQQSHDNLAGLVLDLRGNPGGPDDGSADGAFNNAVGLASIFIADGPIVTATTRNGRLVNPKQYSVIPPTPDQFAGNPQLAHIIADLYRVPLVIITDNSTGGAAEIFAGAMKDNKRAVVIGTPTYGRALGYTREQLPTGGVVTITTLDYFTPAGVNLANQGLAPNMVVEHKRGSKDDEAVATSIPLISHLAAAPKGQAQGDSDDDSGSSGIMNKIMASFAVAMMILGSVLWTVYERQRKRREAERKAGARKTNSGR